jgi:ribonuclease P protein component
VLPPAARLRRRAEFAATSRGGRRAGRGALVVHLAAPGGPAGAPVRAGFTVSKAVGTAVVRNRVRRRLRHLVAERLAALPAGADLVVRALPAAARRDYHQLGRDLDQALAAALAPRKPRGGAR